MDSEATPLDGSADRRSLSPHEAEERKADAIARLAAGVSHDYNNLLTAIVGFADLAADRLDPDEPAQADLRRIVEAVRRAEDLNRELAAAGRRVAASPSDLDLVSLVEGCLRDLPLAPGEPAVTLLPPDGSRPLVMADRTHLRSAIEWLIAFARSYPEPGVPVNVHAGSLRMDAPYEDLHAHVDPGLYGVVSIRGAEAGMTRHVRERIFEPYFARMVGYEGPPVRTAAAMGILRHAGGQLTAVADSCAGPLFRAYLPVAVDVHPSP